MVRFNSNQVLLWAINTILNNSEEDVVVIEHEKLIKELGVKIGSIYHFVFKLNARLKYGEARKYKDTIIIDRRGFKE